MRLARSYKVLNDVAQRRLRRLRALGMQAPSQAAPEANRLLAYVTMEALNTWSLFVRYYLLSIALKPLRCSGGRVTITHSGIAGPGDVLAVAMALLRPWKKPSASGGWSRRDEPTWHETRSLVMCATQLNTSNLPDIQAAISVPTRVFDDLPVFRNFFAHRNDASYGAARSLATHYAIPSADPATILRTRPLGRPWPLAVEWVDDLSVVVELLCQ